MGTSLTGNNISQSYLGLLKSTDSQALGSTAKRLTDGAGNDTPLYLATSRLGIGVASPSRVLDVDGDIEVNGIRIGKGGGSISTNTVLGQNTINNSSNSGAGNVAIGFSTMISNTSGNFNVGIGLTSLQSNTTGQKNIGIGNDSLEANQTGSFNTAIGNESLKELSSGGHNIAIGNDAGNGIQTGSQSIIIGSQADASDVTSQNEIVIGYNLSGNGSNTVTIGNSSITTNYFNGNILLGNSSKLIFGTSDVYISGTTVSDNIQLGVGGSTQFTFAQTTGLRLHQYGSGSITGTVTQRLGVTSTGQVVEIPIGAGALDGSGTAGKIAKFTDSDTLGDSILSESSSTIEISASTPILKFNNLAGGGLDPSLTASGSNFTISTSSTTPLSINLNSSVSTFDGDIIIGSHTLKKDANSSLEFDDDTTDFNPDINSTTIKSISGISLVTNTNDGGGGIFTLNTGSTGTELLRVTTDGSVGLGASPTAKLEIAGGSLASGTVTNLGISSALTTGRTRAYDSGSLASISTRGDSSSVELVAGSSAGYYSGIGLTSRDATTVGGTVIFYTHGSERARIDSSGRVGISTTSPNHLLDVESAGASMRLYNTTSNGNTEFFITTAGTTGASKIMFGDTDDADIGKIIYRHNGNSMAFETNDNEAMRILSDGNVGIGTQNANQDGFGSSSKVLTIKAPSSGGSSALELIGLGNTDNDIVGVLNFMSYAETTPLSAIKGIRHTSDTSGKLGFYTVDTERMRIDQNGFVGINTTSIDRPLHVESSNDSPIQVESTDDTTGIMFKDNNSSNALFYRGNGNYFYTSSRFNVGDLGSTKVSTALGVSATSFDSGNTNGNGEDEFLALFQAGTNSVYKQRYIKIAQTFTGGAKKSPIVVFEANHDGDNHKSYGTIGVDTDGSFQFSNIADQSSAIASGTEIPVTQKMKIESDGRIIINDDANIQGTTFSAGFLKFQSSGNVRLSANDDVRIGYAESLNIKNNGKVLVNVTSNQTDSKLTVRRNGSSFEFGHLNQTSGFYGTIGAMNTSGSPFIAFSADNSSANTFTTRGKKGNVIHQDTGLNGDLYFSQVTDASTADQNLTTRMVLDSSGNFGIGGMTSPDAPLHVRQTRDTNGNMRTNGTYGFIVEGNDSGAVGEGVGIHLTGKNTNGSPTRGVSLLALIQNTGNAHDLVIATSDSGEAPSERARVTDVGDFIVGKSTIAVTSTGFEARASGLLVATRDAGTAGIFNREGTTKGNIVDIRQDNSPVLTMGTTGDNVFLSGTANANDLLLRTNAQNRIRILDYGLTKFDTYGLVTTTPEGRMHQHQIFTMSCTSASSTTAKAMVNVGTTNAFDYTIIARIDATNIGSTSGRTATANGTNSGFFDRQAFNGNVTAITPTYNASSDTLDVAVTYSGSTAPTVHITLNGVSDVDMSRTGGCST